VSAGKYREKGIDNAVNFFNTCRFFCWSQFHQHFISAFAPIILRADKKFNLHCKQKKLCAKLSYEKGARKMLVKLTQLTQNFCGFGANFISLSSHSWHEEGTGGQHFIRF
jgi:hypothetical protein